MSARAQGPAIRIALGANGEAAIYQSRPPATRALIGKSATDALGMIPLLLPICGVAQSVAALRAIEAAMDQPACRDAEIARETALVAEQAAAIAWRLAIDWPPLVGLAPSPMAVKAVRQAAKPIFEATKAVMAPGAAVAAVIRPSWVDEVCDRVEALLDDEGHQGDGPVAMMIRRACLASPGVGAHEGPLLELRGAAETAEDAFGGERFDPLGPTDGPVEVGPLAFSPPPGVEPDAYTGRALLARVMALALDAAALRGRFEAAAIAPVVSRRFGSVAGMGGAMTARGPVFHAVAVSGGMVADWRAMAPTDWHFAPDGPLVESLRAMSQDDRDQGYAALCAASFDPCAPWDIEAVNA